MKKLLGLLSLNILCVACPDIDQNTKINEFEICTTINNVNIDNGTQEAMAHVRTSNNGIERTYQILADINVDKNQRKCGGRFKGKNAELKVISVLHIESITIKAKDGKTVFGSGQLPWDSKIIEVRFDSFYKAPNADPENKTTLKYYLKGFENLNKMAKKDNNNNSHLFKEIENGQQKNKKSQEAVSI